MKSTWFNAASGLAGLAAVVSAPAFAQDEVPDQSEAEKTQVGVTDIVKY